MSGETRDQSLMWLTCTPTRIATILKKANVRDEYMKLIKQTPFGQLVDGVGIFLYASLLNELVEL